MATKEPWLSRLATRGRAGALALVLGFCVLWHGACELVARLLWPAGPMQTVFEYAAFLAGAGGVLLLFLHGHNRGASAGTHSKFSGGKLDSLQESALVGLMFIRRSDGRFIDANAAFLHMLGYTREELVDGHMTWRDITPHGFEAIDRMASEALTRTGALPLHEKAFTRKDGSRVPVLLTAALAADDPGITGCVVLDLTDLRKAEKSARQSEHHKAEIVRVALDAIITIDPTSKVLEWNPAAERVFGYTGQEAIGRRLPELVMFDAEAARHFAGMARFAQTGLSTIMGRRVELTARHKSGREVHVELSVSHSRRDGQDVFIGFVRDVTQAREAERLLGQSEELFRALARNSLDAVQVISPDGSIVYASPASERVLGYPCEDMIGTIAPDYLHPDDLAAATEIIQHIMAEPGRTASATQRIRHRDGSWRWVESTACNLLHEPAIRGIVVNYRDVTERKQAVEALNASEQRFRKIIENSEDAVIMSDSKSGTLFVSPSIEKITGYTPAEFAALPPLEHIHPDDLAANNARREKMMAQPGTAQPLQLRFRHKAGHWIWADTVTCNWLHQDGINAVVTNLRDVTRRMQMEQQLKQAAKMEAIGLLAGGVAHDFNNLLTVITGFVYVLQGELKDNASASAHLAQVAEAADRAAEVTRQLLAFSRRQVLQPRVIDLNVRVQEFEKLLRRLIGEDIELVTRLAPELPKVLADPGQIDQVVMNLAINARDAMPKGGKITIETMQVELDEGYARSHADVKPGDYVMLAVTDTGIGMDAQTRSRAFEPFFTTKEQGKGTGLGLATVYGIVKQSGGHIWLYSEPQQGAVFKVYLPIAEAGAEAPKPGRATPPPTGAETILLAEDEGALRQLLQTVLGASGYHVIAVPNAKEAINAAATNGRIDLLLTDMVMPGMGGRELAEHMTGNRPGIKTIFMSGYTDEGIIDRGLPANGVHFLQKPFSPDVLLKRVREVLDGVS